MFACLFVCVCESVEKLWCGALCLEFDLSITAKEALSTY